MIIYYQGGGFYHVDDNSFVPAEAIVVKHDDYILLIEGQASGKQIVANNDGYPVLIDPRPSPYHTLNGIRWEINKEQKAAKRAEEIAKIREKINALRDEKSAGGVYVEALGKWFDSDAKAQSKLLGLKATMDLVGNEMTVSWTCADNSDFENFGKAQLTVVIAAILTAEDHNHTVARQHKAALDQADNPLEYDYSSGWSKTYAEFLEENNNEK